LEIYLQVFKTAFAAALAWLIVTSRLDWPYPYFAPLAAILTVQVTISESVKKAWQRLLGTITKLEENTIKSIHFIRFAQESLLFNPLMNKKRRRLGELTEEIQHLKNVSIQIRGVRKGFIALTNNLPEKLTLDKLKSAIDVTANCITDFGTTIVDNSENTMACLNNKLGQAKSAQSDCLNELLKFNSLILTREIGAILTDLHRIVEEVAPCKHSD